MEMAKHVLARFKRYLEREPDWANAEDKHKAFVFGCGYSAGEQDAQAKLDELRHALELIGVGDAKDPKAFATKTLVEAGIWDARSVRETEASGLFG